LVRCRPAPFFFLGGQTVGYYMGPDAKTVRAVQTPLCGAVEAPLCGAVEAPLCGAVEAPLCGAVEAPHLPCPWQAYAWAVAVCGVCAWF
jgi:hypothetical protein